MCLNSINNKKKLLNKPHSLLKMDLYQRVQTNFNIEKSLPFGWKIGNTNEVVVCKKEIPGTDYSANGVFVLCGNAVDYSGWAHNSEGEVFGDEVIINPTQEQIFDHMSYLADFLRYDKKWRGFESKYCAD